jgi:hypothetical protein
MVAGALGPVFSLIWMASAGRRTGSTIVER